MTKEDYREKIEEDRQEIEIDGSDARISRTKRKTKKGKNPLIKSLLVVFILIPLTFLIYMKFIYEVDTPTEVAKPKDDVVQVEKNDPTAVTVGDDDEKEADKEVDNEVQIADTKKKEEEAAKKAAEEQEAALKLAQEEAAKKAAAEEAAKKAAAEEAAKKAAAEEAAQPKRTHTVKTNETLYRIAINYYNDPNAVEKIKRANGLSSESISVGQTIVLP